jgi:uncharacterized membrane protein required for colicin V production
MIANLGSLDPIILQVVILGLLVTGALGGFRKGIWLMLFRIAVFVGFLLVVFLFTPVLGGIMRNSGIVENLFGDIDLATIPLIGGLANTILDTVYNVLAAIILLVVGSILNLILSIVFGFIFSKKSPTNRALGAGLGFLINGTIAAAILITVSSSLLFEDGNVWIDNSPGVKEFNTLVVGVQENLLCTNNLPCRIEDFISIGLGAELSQLSSYSQTIGNLIKITESPDDYLSSAFNPDGSFNEEGLLLVLNDLAVITDIASNFGLSNQLVKEFEPQIQEFVNQIPDGAEIEVPAAAIEDLQSIVDNLGLSQALKVQLQNIIDNQLVPIN